MRSLKTFFVTLVLIVIFFAIIIFRQNLLDVINGTKNSAVKNLILENQNLAAQIVNLKNKEDLHDYELRSTKVYSKYPFNNDGKLIINLGEADGIKEGMPVLLKDKILLGKIIDVKRTTAEVETIFSNAWKSSVMIGGESVKALLEGGYEPKINLIAKEMVVGDGDMIKNITPEFPYGLFLGNLTKFSTSSAEPWLNARLQTAYKFENINEVLVITDFNQK